MPLMPFDMASKEGHRGVDARHAVKEAPTGVEVHPSIRPPLLAPGSQPIVTAAARVKKNARKAARKALKENR